MIQLVNTNAAVISVDPHLARIAHLIEKGDLSKADISLRGYKNDPREEVAELRAAVRERMQPPFENFAPIAFQKLAYGDGFARCILHLCKHSQERIRPSGPVVVGIAGPSGAGKSTLAEALVAHLTTHGLKSAEIAVVDQDGFFIPDLKTAAFSGHNPQARDWNRMRERHFALLDTPAGAGALKVVICQSNAAFLDPAIAASYDIKIGMHARPSTLMERRLRSTTQDKSAARQHFLNQTLPDIVEHTYPSLERGADFMVCTDHAPGKVFANKRMQRDLLLRDTMVYLLNCDPAGWDAVWKKDGERFTGTTSWICSELQHLGHRSRSVLELGCGASAKDARFFLESGFSYTGVDVSEVACRKTSERLGDKYAPQLISGAELGSIAQPSRGQSVIVNGESLDVLRGLRQNGATFGVVHSYSSLHYLPPSLLDAALQEIRAICTGYLSLAIKTAMDRTYIMGAETLYPNARVYENGNKCDLRFAYTPEMVRKILENNGFEMVVQNVRAEEFDAAQQGVERYSQFINTIARPALGTGAPVGTKS